MESRYLSVLAVLVTLLYLCFIIFIDISIDFAKTKKCDTTYINPSYRKVPLQLGGEERFKAYSLVQYKEVHSYWVPKEGKGILYCIWPQDLIHLFLYGAVTQNKKKDDAFPILFIHGHLGSHEQMRSMASETAKEIARRYNSRLKVPWADWYAVDFAAEPSGLEPRLRVRHSTSVHQGCM